LGRVVGRRVQMQLDTVAGGEAVRVAAAVVYAEAERRVVGQRRGQVADREDRAEAAQLAGRPPQRRHDRAVRPYLGQGDERRVHRLNVLGRQPLGQLAVDLGDPAPHGLDDLAALAGQLEGDPAAVTGIRAPLEVAPADQHVDQLADRLLGDAELAGQVGPGTARDVDAGQDDAAVPGQV